MADSPTDPQYFKSFDGTRIAWRELGEGRPAVLIHGYFSTAEVNWLKYGHAAKLAARGFRSSCPICVATASATGRMTSPPIRRTR